MATTVGHGEVLYPAEKFLFSLSHAALHVAAADYCSFSESKNELLIKTAEND